MAASHVTLGLIQMRAAASPQVNSDRAASKIKAAARRGAQIICLQELFRTRYFCQRENPRPFELSETIPGVTTDTFCRLARDRSVVLIVPVFEKTSQGIYHNSAVVIDADGSLLGTYRKMHIPYDPHFFEKSYFTPGDTGFRTFTTRFGKIAVLICWDQWFPEAARLATLEGAQILFYPTAIGWHDSETKMAAREQLEAWRVIQRAHAIANAVFVAAVNRVGREEELTFWGRSFAADPFGKVLAQAGGKAEQTLIVKCDMKLIEETRQAWPFWRDRRVDAYGPIAKPNTKLKVASISVPT